MRRTSYGYCARIAGTLVLAAGIFYPSMATAVKAPLAPPEIILTQPTVPYGIFWMSPPVDIHTSYKPKSYLQRSAAAIVVTSTDPKDHKSFKTLPITLSGSIKMTLTGSLTANWRDVIFNWTEYDYRNAVTHNERISWLFFGQSFPALKIQRNIDNPRRLHGSLDGQVRVVLFCDDPQGCQVPSKLSVPAMGVGLYGDGWETSNNEYVLIFKASGTVSVKAVCQFNMSNTVFNNIEVKPKPAPWPVLLPTQQNLVSHVNVQCTDMPLKRKQTRNVNLVFTPDYGTAPHSNNTIANTDRPGLGIVYDIGQKPTSCSTGHTFFEPQVISVIKKKNKNKKYPQPDVYWGMCQYDKIEPGPFKSTINYNIWIE